MTKTTKMYKGERMLSVNTDPSGIEILESFGWSKTKQKGKPAKKSEK